MLNVSISKEEAHYHKHIRVRVWETLLSLPLLSPLPINQASFEIGSDAACDKQNSSRFSSEVGTDCENLISHGARRQGSRLPVVAIQHHALRLLHLLGHHHGMCTMTAWSSSLRFWIQRFSF